MLLYVFSTSLILGSVMSRDILRTSKPVPIITDSLLNLGKMDISFNINVKDLPKFDTLREEPLPSHHSNPVFYQEPEVQVEPCPCSALRNLPTMGNPSEIINRILRGNELFSYNKESEFSTTCCESREESIILDFSPRAANGNFLQNMAPVPEIIVDSVMSHKPLLPVPDMRGFNPKGIEIFLFPKKNEFNFVKKNGLPKPKNFIQFVGDKDMKTDNIKSFALGATSSVKKDLTNQDIPKTIEKEDTPTEKNTEIKNNLNSLV